MKNYFLLLAMLCVANCFAQVSVKGYFRKDGTYVQPHMRSSPNYTKTDNYSYPGNVNPYTGKVAPGTPPTTTTTYPSVPPTPAYIAPTYSAPKTFIEPEKNRTYRLDQYGNKTVYTVVKYTGKGVVASNIYNMQDEMIGYLCRYDDLSYIVYDLQYNEVKRGKENKPDYAPSPLLKQY